MSRGTGTRSNGRTRNLEQCVAENILVCAIQATDVRDSERCNIPSKCQILNRLLIGEHGVVAKRNSRH